MGNIGMIFFLETPYWDITALLLFRPENPPKWVKTIDILLNMAINLGRDRRVFPSTVQLFCFRKKPNREQSLVQT